MKVDRQLFSEFFLTFTLWCQGTSKKKVLDQPDGMVVQAQLNITMPGRFWLVFSEIGLPCVFPSLFHLFFFCRTHNLLPGVSPSKDDDYICTGVSIGDLSPDKVKSTFDKVDPNRCFNQTVYAVSFSALGQDGPGIKAHHMILSKCKKPKKTGFGDTWDCQHHAMCNDQVYDCLH